MSFHYRIRGICTTALSKMLLDNGHHITDVSRQIKQRFPEISDEYHPPDAYILENDEKTGFYCRGENSAVKALEALIQENLEFPFIMKPPLRPNAILKGKVSRIDRNGITVTLYQNYIGRLIPPIPQEIRKGQELLVCVKGHEIYAKKAIPVSTSLIISGKNVAILYGINRPYFSKYLPRWRREELDKIKLPFEDIEFPCTVRWRAAAAHATTKELLAELNLLKTTLITVLDESVNVEPGAILYEGQNLFHTYLSSQEKNKFDQIREKVTPTIPGHHIWKAMGLIYSDFIDYMELLLEKEPGIGAKISDSFKEYILKRMKTADQPINIFHWKPDGRYYKIGPARVKEINDENIVLIRQVMSTGIYDGLNIEKRKGDLIETIIPLKEEWFFQHNYFSVDGQLKGSYFNINTPIELGFDNIRYFDLLVDVVKLPTEEPKIIDIEELDLFVSRNIIRIELKKKIMEIAKNLQSKLK